MFCTIKTILGVVYAFMHVYGEEGGYVGKGSNNSEALRNVFENYKLNN